MKKRKKSSSRPQESEIVTSNFEPVELMRQAGEIAKVLSRMGIRTVEVEYGWGCRLPEEALWQRMPVSLDSLAGVLAGAIESGIFHPGSSDLSIVNSEEMFDIRICHESDIHVRTTNSRLTEHLLQMWGGEGVTLAVRTGEGRWKPA